MTQKKIIEWSNKWAIDFNQCKTVNVDFSRKNYIFQNCNSVISQFLSHTHLGIHFQSDGHWNKHIHTIHDKAVKRLNLLRMLKYKLNRKSLVIIYNAWIRPVLEYGDIVLDNCSIKDSQILEDLQVETARIITGLGHNSSRSKLYDELGWDLLNTRRMIHKLILLYKIIN